VVCGHNQSFAYSYSYSRGVNLENLPETASVALSESTKGQQLLPFEKNYAEFIREIHSPFVFIQSIEIESSTEDETLSEEPSKGMSMAIDPPTTGDRQVYRVKGQNRTYTRVYTHCGHCGRRMRIE